MALQDLQHLQHLRKQALDLLDRSPAAQTDPSLKAELADRVLGMDAEELSRLIEGLSAEQADWKGLLKVTLAQSDKLEGKAKAKGHELERNAKKISGGGKEAEAESRFHKNAEKLLGGL